MNAMLDILAAVTPMDRFHAVRTLGDEPAVAAPSVWLIAVYVAGAAAVAALLIFAYRRLRAAHRARASLRTLTRELGLSAGERSLLTRIARLAGEPNAMAVMTREALFNIGTAALMHNEPVVSMTPQARARINGAVTGLRKKLGFISRMDVKTKTQPAGVPLAEGAKVEITLKDDPTTYPAVVKRADGADLTLETPGAVPCQNDDFCRIRYGCEGTLWECDGFVLAGSASRLSVRLAGVVRTLDMRKYPRVRREGEARVAEFPLVKDGRASDAPAFVPARVTEAGGPGLKLDSPLHVAEGERILVVLKLGERTIQGVGRVRRVSPLEDGVYVTAVEMVGLTEAELKEFLRETQGPAARPQAAVQAATPVVPQSAGASARTLQLS